MRTSVPGEPKASGLDTEAGHLEKVTLVHSFCVKRHDC